MCEAGAETPSPNLPFPGQKIENFVKNGPLENFVSSFRCLSKFWPKILKTKKWRLREVRAYL